MANQQGAVQDDDEVYHGPLPLYMSWIGRHRILHNAYNSANEIFDGDTPPIPHIDAIEWKTKDVKQYLVALQLGTGLFFTNTGNLIADNYEDPYHEFDGDDVAAAIRPVRWSNEPKLYIRLQTNAPIVVEWWPDRVDGEFALIIHDVRNPNEWTLVGGPVFHNPPYHGVRSQGDDTDSDDEEEEPIATRIGDGGHLDWLDEPEFLVALRLNKTFRISVISRCENITGEGVDPDRLHLEWGRHDLRVYRAAKQLERAIELGRDGRLYVQHFDEEEDQDDLLVQGDTPGDGVFDDGWYSDFEPNVRINDARNESGVSLVPMDGIMGDGILVRQEIVGAFDMLVFRS